MQRPSVSPAISIQRDRLSLAEHAYLSIREKILKGVLPLGAELSRRKLAAELGISMLPVAEALQRLENEELVVSKARVGTCVCMPTPEEIRERYEVREALESQSARLFSERATQTERREIGKMAERLDVLFNQCAEAPCDREFMYAVHTYHFEFHLRIAEGARCSALQRLIERNHVLVFNWLFDVAARHPSLPKHFHRDLTATIVKGDAEEADRAMRHHIRYGLNRVVNEIVPLAMPGKAARLNRPRKA